MRRKVAIGLVLIAISIAGAIAGDDLIAQRRALMRDNARIERTANSVILGKFLPDKASAAMKKLQANMEAFVAMFPDGSETGGETHASSTIWTGQWR